MFFARNRSFHIIISLLDLLERTAMKMSPTARTTLVHPVLLALIWQQGSTVNVHLTSQATTVEKVSSIIKYTVK